MRSFGLRYACELCQLTEFEVLKLLNWSIIVIFCFISVFFSYYPYGSRTHIWRPIAVISWYCYFENNEQCKHQVYYYKISKSVKLTRSSELVESFIKVIQTAIFRILLESIMKINNSSIAVRKVIMMMIFFYMFQINFLFACSLVISVSNFDKDKINQVYLFIHLYVAIHLRPKWICSSSGIVACLKNLFASA